MPLIEFDIEKTIERLKILGRRYLPTSNGFLRPDRRNFYTSPDRWVDPVIWRDFQHTRPREACVFVDENCRELVEKLLELTHAVSGDQNPSHLLRFVAAVAGRHLDVLAQLENLKRVVFDAALFHIDGVIPPPNRSKPAKDHVLHAACVLDTAVHLLDQPAQDGSGLYLKLFAAMEIAYCSVFPNAVPQSNPLANITTDEDRRAFVTDCCVGAVLAHDNGYLPMFELHLRDARVGHLMGFLKDDRDQPARNRLRGWLERVEHEVTEKLVNMGADRAALEFLLPPFRVAWMTDTDLRKKPDKLHGFVSGYQLLDYFFCSTPSAWEALARAEQWMLLMIAGASIFHGSEFVALCAPRLRTEDVWAPKLLKAALSDLKNPVRRVLDKEQDRDNLLRHIDQVDTNSDSLLTILARLNKWIEEETLHDHAEFQETLKESNPLSHELREMLGDKHKDKGDHANAWLMRLNRLILEASLGGLRSSLDDALEQSWNLNPLGLYLHMVGGMQEWVRLTWKTTHKLFANPKTPCLFGRNLGLDHVEGLTAIIGQAPIPRAEIEFPENGAIQRVVIRFIQSEMGEELFVVKYGSFNFSNITGGLWQDRTIPAAMRIISGYPDVVCILVDDSDSRVNSVFEQMQQEAQTWSSSMTIPDLTLKDRRKIVKPILRCVEVRKMESFVFTMRKELRERLQQFGTPPNSFAARYDVEALIGCMKESLKAAALTLLDHSIIRHISSSKPEIHHGHGRS